MTLIDRNLLGELVNNDNVHYEDIMSIPTVNVNNLIVEELEKIREELKELAFDFDDLSPDKELVVDLDNIEEVIDKHISELKGENK